MPLNSNQGVITDVDNNQTTGATGAAVVAGAVQVGASDGTNLRLLLTDTSGRQRMVGAAAAGATPVGDPVYIAGSDGADLQAILTDTSGRQIAVGAAAAGAAIAGNPVLTGGSDGTNARALLTDTSGRQIMVGAGASGAAVVGNPVLAAGSDGTNTRTLLTTNTGILITQTSPTVAGTGTATNVAASATSVTLLAANANRLGATIVNDGNARLYAKCAATASATSYTVEIPARGYWEVPFNYTGVIDGIWSSANGSARVTEFEA